MMFSIVLVAVALYILVIVWLTHIKPEEDEKEDFDKFVEHVLKNVKHRREIELKQSVKLADRVQLVVFGVEHSECSTSPWSLVLVTENNEQIRISPVRKGKFWYARITPWVEKNSTNITCPFQVQELIWNETKEHVQARCFLVSDQEF